MICDWSYETLTTVSIGKMLVPMATQADIHQLIAQAIDAKCRLEDNFELFTCLSRLISKGIDRKIIKALIEADTTDEAEYLQYLEYFYSN